MSNPKITISIDPLIEENYGPEVHWTWRQILGTIGWCWIEVPFGKPCDIAFTSQSNKASACRCTIYADTKKWKNANSLRLEGIGRAHNLPILTFSGEKETFELNADTHSNGDSLTVGHDLVFDLFWLVTDLSESSWIKDTHGRPIPSDSDKLTPNHIREALGSEIINWLHTNLSAIGFPVAEEKWPDKKKAVACYSHDVDYPVVVRWLEPLRAMRRNGLSSFKSSLDLLTGKRHHWHFDDWCELEAKYGVHSAFYFFAGSGSLMKYAQGLPDPFYDISQDRFATLFEKLRNSDAEIGLHAGYRTSDSFDELKKQKERLENYAKVPIKGGRHHYWRFSKESPEDTLLWHEKLGMHYDASLGMANHVGFRRSLSTPFFPYNRSERRELSLVEIPTAWMDDHLFGYKSFNTGEKHEILKSLAQTILHQGGCFMSVIHNYVFDSQLFPGWRDSYEFLLDYISGNDEFSTASPAAIAAHWKNRYRRLLSESCGLDKGRETS